MDISLIMATRKNIPQLEVFLTSLANTISKPELLELLIKIDRNDESMLEYYYEEKYKKFNLNINFVITDQRNGYFSLGNAYNQLMVASNPETYYILMLNDGVKFVYNGWDEEIRKYKHHFPDDIFYIKTSKFKNEIYEDNLFYMITKPDNYSIYTRKLISLMEGIGDYWSYDSWFQPILSFLEEKYGHRRFLIFNDDLFDPASQIESIKSPKDAIKISSTFIKLMQEPYTKNTFDRIAKKIANVIN